MTTERGREINTYTLTGIVLIVIGIDALAYQDTTYTTREKVVGPIQMAAERTKPFSLPLLIGAVALVGGIVLLVVESWKG